MCKWIIRIFALLYLLAFLVYMVSLFGLFGAEQDPLSGVFLIMLGVPWTHFGGDWPDPWPMLTGLFAPAVNLLILVLLCRLLRRRA